MSIVLGEGDFELDGSLVLRSSKSPLSPVSIQSIDFGGIDITSQSTSNPVGDDMLFGVDRYVAPVWTFTLNCRGTTGQSLDGGEQVRTAWQNDSVRLVPGAMSVLRYQLAGRTRRVYGRGGRVTPDYSNLLTSGYSTMLAEFQLKDPNTYDDIESQLNLDLITNPGAGITLPATFPWVWGASSTERSGVVNVAGGASTPMRIEVYGPSTGSATSPSLSSTGWQIEFPGLEIAYDQILTIDTRAKTALLNGVSVAGKLARKSSLASRLQVGSQEVLFSCVDPTNSARAVVYWRTAYRSL